VIFRRTIRARTTLTAVSVIGIAVVGSAIALVVLLQRSLLGHVDTRASFRLQDVAILAERGQLPSALAGGDEDGTVAQVVVNGRVVAQSPVVTGSQPMAKFVPPDGAVALQTMHNLPIVGGGPYRVAAKRVITPDGPGVVYTAASTEPATDSIHALKVVLAFVVPGLVLLVGGITWRVVGRTLAPVESIRRQVAEISAKELSLRVPEPGTGDEIDKLAETMNVMLTRLEGSVARQRAFLSDAAHELRSPVAAMRAELDIAASHPEIGKWPDVVDRLGMSTRRLERLIEDLLVLATREERGVQHRAEVDLDEIVIRQTQPLRASSRLHVDLEGLNAARIWGDREQLERVVANLVDNAERHAATTIVVGLHVHDDSAEMVVQDDGPGIPAASRLRVFDRFSRLDEARDRPRGGAGLGLAIARRIVEDHNGSIEVANSNGGARVVVRLPVGGG
jgi:signal transduction histidine kinase